MKRFTCPHCGEPSFTPLQKALAGSLRSRGKPCPHCGKRCCNSMASIYFSTVVSLIAFVSIMAIYLLSDNSLPYILIMAAIIAGSLLLNFLFNMFFGKLVQPIRIMN